MTRSLRRRSGDSVRSGRRNRLVRGDRRSRRDPALGLERPRGAPDLLPSPDAGPRQRGEDVLRRPAADVVVEVRRPLARHRRRHRHRAGERDCPRDHPRRADQRRSSSLTRRRATTSSPPRSSRTRSTSPPRSPVCPPRRSARWHTPTPPARSARSSGRSGSPNTTTPSTTCSSLCNLALLTGHVGRWGSGLVPLRGQNNVQGGGDMGALPNKLPGFQNIDDDADRGKFEAVYGMALNPTPGIHLTLMFEAMERGDLTAAYVVGRTPPTPRPTSITPATLLGGLDCLVVQDIFLTRTAEMADVVFPASVAWAESDGTVTSSERRVQRVRAAVTPPGEARHDIDIMIALADRMGVDLGTNDPEALWDELRSLSPLHAGMSYERLDRRRSAVAVPEPRSPGFSVPPRMAVGRRPRGTRPGTVLGRRTRRSEGAAHRRLPAAPHDRPLARLVQHRVCSRTDSRHRSGTARRSTSTRPMRHRSAWSTVNECVCRRRAVRSRWRSDSNPTSRRPDVHDLSLPRSRRHQQADERRVGQAVGHVGVQGCRHPHRQARRPDPVRRAPDESIAMRYVTGRSRRVTVGRGSCG